MPWEWKGDWDMQLPLYKGAPMVLHLDTKDIIKAAAGT